MNKILRLLNKYNNETMNKLITKGNYDNSFKNQIFNVLDKFIQNYNFNINKQIYYLDNKNIFQMNIIELLREYLKKKTKNG